MKPISRRSPGRAFGADGNGASCGEECVGHAAKAVSTADEPASAGRMIERTIHLRTACSNHGHAARLTTTAQNHVADQERPATWSGTHPRTDAPERARSAERRSRASDDAPFDRPGSRTRRDMPASQSSWAPHGAARPALARHARRRARPQRPVSAVIQAPGAHARRLHPQPGASPARARSTPTPSSLVRREARLRRHRDTATPAPSCRRDPVQDLHARDRQHGSFAVDLAAWISPNRPACNAGSRRARRARRRSSRRRSRRGRPLWTSSRPLPPPPRRNERASCRGQHQTRAPLGDHLQPEQPGIRMSSTATSGSSRRISSSARGRPPPAHQLEARVTARASPSRNSG